MNKLTAELTAAQMKNLKYESVIAQLKVKVNEVENVNERLKEQNKELKVLTANQKIIVPIREESPDELHNKIKSIKSSQIKINEICRDFNILLKSNKLYSQFSDDEEMFMRELKDFLIDLTNTIKISIEQLKTRIEKEQMKLQVASRREQELEQKEKELRVEVNRERIDNTHLNESIAELRSLLHQKEFISKMSQQEIEVIKKRNTLLENDLKEVNKRYTKFEETIESIVEKSQIDKLRQELKQALIENKYIRSVTKTNTYKDIRAYNPINNDKHKLLELSYSSYKNYKTPIKAQLYNPILNDFESSSKVKEH